MDVIKGTLFLLALLSILSIINAIKACCRAKYFSIECFEDRREEREGVHSGLKSN